MPDRDGGPSGPRLLAMTRLAALLAAPLAVALAGTLGACSAAEDAVSSVSSSARQAAQQKAQEVAVHVLRSQACSLTADGTLSSADVAKLRAGLDAAAAAGAPAEVVDAVRPLVERGSGATKAQVARVHKQVCGS
jgi:hypothetical protein